MVDDQEPVCYTQSPHARKHHESGSTEKQQEGNWEWGVHPGWHNNNKIKRTKRWEEWWLEGGQ